MKSNRRFAVRVFGPLLGIALLAACATPPAGDDAYDDVNDPLEGMNRVIFSFNQFFDGLLFKPLALMYRDLLPPEIQDGIGGILETLRTPVVLANDLLQGDMDRAGETLGRFAVNATVGIGGIFDVATDMGLEGHGEDFGQTLAVWGSGEGMYLVLPLFGPSNPRDAIGMGVDTLMDPLRYYASTEELLARTLVRGVDERAGVVDTLDEIARTSIDFYATMRSLYRQHRDDLIRNGSPAPVIPIPSISFDDFTSPQEEQAALVE
jgi:phospholipid-binding lipoprotein MlaA